MSMPGFDAVKEATKIENLAKDFISHQSDTSAVEASKNAMAADKTALEKELTHIWKNPTQLKKVTLELEKISDDIWSKQPEQTAEPANQVPPNRGYGPPRTGLDWQPFLANLRPRAVASSLRQGDDFSSKGDWASALKDYDLASRIDPANQLAKQKAAEARQKLGQQTNQSPTMSNSPTPLRAPDVGQNQLLPPCATRSMT